MHERRIKNHEIFFTDGIFILNKGAFIPQYKISNESTKIELNIYETKNHLYSFFLFSQKSRKTGMKATNHSLLKLCCSAKLYKFTIIANY